VAFFFERASARASSRVERSGRDDDIGMHLTRALRNPLGKSAMAEEETKAPAKSGKRRLDRH